jgi:hypothetical protein
VRRAHSPEDGGHADQTEAPYQGHLNGPVLAGSRENRGDTAFDEIHVLNRPMLLLQDRPAADRHTFQMRAQVFESFRRHARQNAIENRERGRGGAWTRIVDLRHAPSTNTIMRECASVSHDTPVLLPARAALCRTSAEH